MSSFRNNGQSGGQSGGQSECNSFLFTLIILLTPILYKIIPYNEIYKIVSNYFIESSDDISINIPSHEIPIYKGLCTTPTIKNIYSKDFLSILYYVMQNCSSDINSITEIISDCKDLSNYYYDDDEAKTDQYIYIPISKKKMLICDKNKIYCELNIFEGNEDKENGNDSTKNKNIKKKSYILILSMPVTGNINILKDFIKECKKVYEKSKIKNDSNKRQIFVYDKSEKGESRTELYFKNFPMEHNKDLNMNIFFEGKDRLINYITPFIYDKDEISNVGEERYKRSGFTFKAGLLFYGAPGCGKTSTIKAILRYTNRHAVIINLNRIKTCEELENVFRKRTFDGKELSGKELCYVLEDCDATGETGSSVLSNRKKTKTSNFMTDSDIPSQKPSESENIVNKLLEFSTCSLKPDDDSVNLSCFLNILDGIIELHGVMIIMTTNYPEKIDDALIRPGRFDFKYEFKRASREIIRDMLKFKYEISEKKMCEYDSILNIKDEVLSPAQIQAVCFQNSNIVDCINELVLLGQKV
jgi:hypothetical protein